MKPRGMPSRTAARDPLLLPNLESARINPPARSMNSGFLDKLIERISRVRPEEVQNYLHRLADEKGFLETIFNAIHEGVIVTDPQGRVNYLNHAACELFGLQRDECMGRSLGERL